MMIAGRYSFNGGEEYINAHFSQLLAEIEECVRKIDTAARKSKESSEKTMPGKMLYSPASLNGAFREFLVPRAWINGKTRCEYSREHYTDEYISTNPKPLHAGAFRDMDFVKDDLGMEVQFGKYSFMVYNVCAKMTIFKNLGMIQAGIEIVLVKQLADDMSSGVSYFEQFVWDLTLPLKQVQLLRE